MNQIRLFLTYCVLLSLLWRCSPPLATDKLEGYWQIEKVQQKSETFVPAVGNVQYDFYQLNANGNGFRKKMSPGLGKQLNTSLDQTNFALIQEGNQWKLHFETAWDEWKETILKLDDQQLVLKHGAKTYTYQRKRNNNGTP